MATMEIKVPDIGDFKDVPIIELLVKVGDMVAREQSLFTVESDKATMEIPSPEAGVVTALAVKLGDVVNSGSVIGSIEVAAAPLATAVSAAVNAPPAQPAPVVAAATAAAPTPAPSATPAPAVGHAALAAGPVPQGDLHADVLVLGAGPGGYTAAFRAADLGRKVVLIERYPTLGGVCLNVGCIPSKALLHAAKVITEAEEMGHNGISFGKPAVDIEKLRGWKDSVVGKLTRGLGSMAKGRRVTVLEGVGKFTSANMVEVAGKDGVQRVSFDHCIIAAGSQVTRLPGLPYTTRASSTPPAPSSWRTCRAACW